MTDPFEPYYVVTLRMAGFDTMREAASFAQKALSTLPAHPQVRVLINKIDPPKEAP
ncbi:MAG: hypothetical protein IT555_21945 [Acetobacteraceae bacterium]|nr:hypothetical protein [Acetobacteraceae bacterium]